MVPLTSIRSLSASHEALFGRSIPLLRATDQYRRRDQDPPLSSDASDEIERGRSNLMYYDIKRVTDTTLSLSLSVRSV